MSAQPEEFEQVQKLLKLKRYEQPPPRFFNEFSSNVISRLHEEATASTQEKLWMEAPWLKSFFQFLEKSPLAAGSFAASLCALLVGGLVYSEYSDRGVSEALGSESNHDLAQLRLNAMKREMVPVSSTNAILTGGLGLNPFETSVTARPVSWNAAGIP